jgi:hypothetical protein
VGRQLSALSVRRRESSLIDSSAFQSLAEFSIALAGFTSIVVVFSRRDGEFHPGDRFRIRIALVASLGAAFLALVPVGLELTGLSPSAVWRVSSLVLVSAVAWDSVHAYAQLNRLPPDARAVLSSRLSSFLRALRLFSFLAGVLNGTGLLFVPQPGVYFFAVFCALLYGAIAFVRMVFVRPAV